MRILFFDIDGTLIRSGGAGMAAMRQALAQEFGLTQVREDISFSGRTDPSIGFDLLRHHDLDVTEANRVRLEDAYLALLPEMLTRAGGLVLPGIERLLAGLAERDHLALGLLTGNVRRGAEVKLTHFKLWDYFRFGGFGDGFHDRDDVARSAMVEAERFLGRRPDPNDVWVIGDTPLDVRCARAIGAKAVAVATGWHSVEELAASEPDCVLSDFTQAPELLAAWGVA